MEKINKKELNDVAAGLVNADEMKKCNENNPQKALEGSVPGVKAEAERVPNINISADGNPSSSATVRIR